MSIERLSTVSGHRVQFRPEQIANARQVFMLHAGDAASEAHFATVGFLFHEAFNASPRSDNDELIVAPLPKKIGYRELSDAHRVLHVISGSPNTTKALAAGRIDETVITDLKDKVETRLVAARLEQSTEYAKRRRKLGLSIAATGLATVLYGATDIYTSLTTDEIAQRGGIMLTIHDAATAYASNIALENMKKVTPQKSDIYQHVAEQSRDEVETVRQAFLDRGRRIVVDMGVIVLGWGLGKAGMRRAMRVH